MFYLDSLLPKWIGMFLLFDLVQQWTPLGLAILAVLRARNYSGKPAKEFCKMKSKKPTSYYSCGKWEVSPWARLQKTNCKLIAQCLAPAYGHECWSCSPIGLRIPPVLLRDSTGINPYDRLRFIFKNSYNYFHFKKTIQYLFENWTLKTDGGRKFIFKSLLKFINYSSSTYIFCRGAQADIENRIHEYWTKSNRGWTKARSISSCRRHQDWGHGYSVFAGR